MYYGSRACPTGPNWPEPPIQLPQKLHCVRLCAKRFDYFLYRIFEGKVAANDFVYSTRKQEKELLEEFQDICADKSGKICSSHMLL